MTERILFSIHPRYLITRIAENSSILNDIQDQGGDGFNISEGYPAAYAKPFDQGGKPLNRAELNNVFNLLSQLHFYWQMGGAPLWDNRIAEGIGMYAPLSGYPRNARVHRMIESNLIEFISQKDDNRDDPKTADKTSWKRVTLGDDAVTRPELSAVSSNIETTIQSLSGNAKKADQALATSISTLSGNVTSAISTLSGDIQATITSLSGNAKKADQALATSISTLSGNVTSLSGVVGTIDGKFAKYSLTSHSHSQYATTSTTNTLSGYITSLSTNTVKTSGNQTISGIKTFSSGIPTLRVEITSTQDVSVGTADDAAPFVIGPKTGQHIVMDMDEIMSKSTSSTVGSLYLNHEGGLVQVGIGGSDNGSTGLKTKALWLGNVTSGLLMADSSGKVYKHTSSTGLVYDDKGTISYKAIGASAGQVAAGNHTHSNYATTSTTSTLSGYITSLQRQINALSGIYLNRFFAAD